MSTPSPQNRWIPFQCPSCFALFRLRKSEVGQAGRCPTCQAIVRASDAEVAGEFSAVRSAAPIESAPEDLLERVSVAQPMTPEELAARAKAKRKVNRAVAEDNRWDGNDAEEVGKKSSWMVIASMVLSALLVGAFVIKYFGNRWSAGSEVVSAADLPSEKILNEIIDAERSRESIEDDEELLSAMMSLEDIDLELMEEAVKGFLTAETVSEMAKYVRDSERVSYLMKVYYGERPLETPGFESLNKSEVSVNGSIIATVVQTGDYLFKAIWLERALEEDGGRYLVDWESWVGHGDLLPEQMREKRPSEPFKVRVEVTPMSYYNYGYSDDTVWQSFGLEFKNCDYSFLGYAKRGSKVEQALSLAAKRLDRAPYYLKVAYPPGARAKDQLEIVEIVAENWLNQDEKSND